MKTALMILNIGDFLRENSRASFHAAARRWGCDYVEVTEAHEGIHPHAMKLKAFDLCDADRIFYVDADAIISEECPNPFEAFPPDIFVAVPNQQPQMTESCRIACADNIMHDLRTITEHFGPINAQDVALFINAGFWIASRQYHEAMLKMALEISLAMLGITAWHDQSALNYALMKMQIPVLRLPETWNYQFPPDTGAGEMTKFIYHWAGGENRNRIPGVNWNRKKRLLWIGDAV